MDGSLDIDEPSDIGIGAVLSDIPGDIGVEGVGVVSVGFVVGVEGVSGVCAKAVGAAASMAATAPDSAQTRSVDRVDMGGEAPFRKNRSGSAARQQPK